MKASMVAPANRSKKIPFYFKPKGIVKKDIVIA